jgi:peptidoglycan hydrolase-like protein with peptidoglycan-binding domain
MMAGFKPARSITALTSQKGAHGQHVARIQLVLSSLGFTDVDKDPVGSYGEWTAKAVVAYKTNHTPPIINHTYQHKPDPIVGEMTIRALDKDEKAWEDSNQVEPDDLLHVFLPEAPEIGLPQDIFVYFIGAPPGQEGQRRTDLQDTFNENFNTEET